MSDLHIAKLPDIYFYPYIYSESCVKAFLTPLTVALQDFRFPPRKVLPAEDQQFLPTHSPLSPLTPSSPLYPDGLIAPIWIRKHTGLVPSVFVLFKRLYEFPRTSPTSPLDAPDPEHERSREAEEKRRDAELSAEIAHRKKSTNERAIKLTVVLMASRKLLGAHSPLLERIAQLIFSALDDPSLDARLTFIRRQSGLDPRAALFVLSPVSQAEIGDFVRRYALPLSAYNSQPPTKNE